MAVALVGVVSSAQATPADQDAEAVGNALESFATRLASVSDGLGDYGDLTESLPLTDLAPGDPDALDLSNLLSTYFTPANLGTFDNLPDLADAVDALDNDSGALKIQFGQDLTTPIAPAAAAVTATATSITIPIAARRSVSVPLGFQFGPTEMSGGTLAVDFTLDTTLTFTVDPSQVSDADTAPATAVSLAPPTIDLCANATGSVDAFTARLGFTDVTVSTDDPAIAGPQTATLHACAEVDFTDPDSTGGITGDEWASHALTELASAEIVDGPGTDLHAKFFLDASLIPGDADGMIEFTDTNLSDAGSPGLPTTDLGFLADFNNIDIGDVAQGLANFAASLSGAQTRGNGPLPFLEDGLSKAFDAAGPIVKYVKQITDADVVCGTEQGAADSDQPTGSTSNLTTGTQVFCRATTPFAVSAGTVAWVSPNASEGTNATGPDADDTVGATPSDDAVFTMTSDGTFDVKLTFTQPDPDGGGPLTTQTVTAVSKPQTATELFQKLAAAAGITPGAGDLTYDTTKKALTFRLHRDGFTPPAATTNIDFGDKLRDLTNIAGLSATGSASASITPGALNLDVTFGALLVPNLADITPGNDPATTLDDTAELIDRFFVKTNSAAGSHEFSLQTLDATATVSLKGQVGFLEVSAQGDGSENGADAGQAFKITRADPDKPVVAVDINAPGAGVQVDTDPGPGSTLVNLSDTIGLEDLLFHLDAAHLEATCNLRMSAGLSVSASVGGNAQFAKGGVAVNWPTVFKADSCEPNPATLAVTADTDFDANLKNFDPFPSVSGVHDGSDGVGNLHDSTRDFEDNSASGENLLNLTLRNKTTGASCLITLINQHDLNCTLAGGSRPADPDPLNANRWKQGDEYTVDGNPLALLGIIIDNLDELVAKIDDLDPNLTDQQIPLINKSTKELVGKIQGLKATLDDLRGFPLATVKCFRDAAGTDENLQDLPDNATIYCRATSGISPATVKWTGKRIDDGNGGFAAGEFTAGANGTALTTVGSTPTALAAIPISDGDGDSNTLLGEWRVTVEFEDAAGLHTAEFPRATPPASLQKLEELIEDKLDIGDPNVFKLDLLDLPAAGAEPITDGSADGSSTENVLVDNTNDFDNGDDDPEVGRLLVNVDDNKHCTITVVAEHSITCAAGSAMSWGNGDAYEVVGDGTKDLIVHLGMGYCAGGTNPGDLTCESTDRTVPPISVPLNVDLGLAGDLVSVSTAGELDLQFAARASLDLGIPLKLAVPSVVVLDSTGASIEGRLVADNLALEASIGPVGVKLGTGIVDTDSVMDGNQQGVGVARAGATITVAKSGGDDADANRTFTIGDFFGGVDIDFAGVDQECDAPPGNPVEESGDACGVISVEVAGQAFKDPLTISCTAEPLACTPQLPAGLQLLLSGKPLDFSLLIQVLPRILTELQTRLDGAAQDIHLPVIGDALDGGAKVVGKFNDNVVIPFAQVAAQIQNAVDTDNDMVLEPNEIAGKVRQFIWDGAGTGFDGLGTGASAPNGANLILDSNGDGTKSIDDVIVTALCTDALTPCADGQIVNDIRDFRITFLLGQDLVDEDTPFNIGLKGLPLKLTGAVKTDVNWQFLVDFGLSKAEGPYMGTDGPTTIPDDDDTKANRPADHEGTPDDPDTTDIDEETPSTWEDVKYLQDDDADFTEETVEIGMWLHNVTTDEGCRITQIVDEHTLSCDDLQTGDVEEGVDWHQSQEEFEGPIEADTYTIIARHDGGEDSPELSFTASVGMGTNLAACTGDPLITGRGYLDDFSGDRCLKGEIAFLAVTVRDADAGDGDVSEGEDPTSLALTASIDFANKTAGEQRITFADLTAGNIAVSPKFDVTANVDVRFRTGLRGDENAGFPSVLGKFHLYWNFNITTEGPENSGLDVSFDGINLDLGAFVSDFLRPVTSGIKNVTKPLMPVIQFLQAPIPVISDISEAVGQGPVTMLDVLEALSGNDLSLMRSLIQFVTFANSLPDDGPLLIPLGNLDEGGSFSVSSARATGPPPTPDSNAQGIQNAVAKKNVQNSLAARGANTPPADNRPGTFGVAGLTFPFLSNATQIFGVLLGQDVVLVHYDAGVMKAKAGFGYSFPPIMAGPIPVKISIGGSVEVKGRFAIGYDTSGLRKVLDGGSGEHLLDGIFIDDLAADGSDPPEIELIGTVYVEGAASIAIISVGVRGELIFTTSLDLDDSPNADGKLHIDEIISKLSNPICLFIVRGQLDVSLKAFVEIDLFFFTKRFTIEIVRITLLKFEVKCEPPVPNLADAVSTTGDAKAEKLIINTGPRKPNRNIRQDVDDEKFTVRQMEAYTTGPNAGTTRFAITAFGINEDEFLDTAAVNGGTAVVVTGDILTSAGADLDGGTDTYSFLPGGQGGAGGTSPASSVVDFKPKVVVYAGPGDDQVTTADGNDDVHGGAGNDTLSTGKGVDIAAGDADNDTIDVGPGNDVNVTGGDGDDTMSGGAGADTMDGGNGDDNLGGAGGAAGDDGGDTLTGGPGNDTLAGVAGDDILRGDNDDECSDNTADVDTNDAGTEVAGDNIDSLDGGDGNDHLFGGPESDQIAGKNGDDELCGNGGNDEITGENGKDTADGGSGDDNIIGGQDSSPAASGGDVLKGGSGRDYIVGDEGTLVRDGSNNVTVSLLGVFLGNDMIEGGANNDFLYGQGGVDTMKGDGGNDFMRGSVGNDLMQGNGGADEMYGDEDIDTMYGSDDDLTTEAGDDGGDTMRGGTGTDAMYGDEGGDTMYGDNDVDTMLGGTGDDVLRGGGGDDKIEGNENVTDAVPADSNPTDGASDGDVIFGDAGQDDLVGGSQTTAPNGAPYDGPDEGDTILGNAEQDVIVGDNGTISRLVGDQVDGTHNRTVVLDDPGSSTEGGRDNIEGNDEDDDIYGGGDDDEINGNAGDDYVEGNGGADDIFGDGEQDDLIGGTSQGGTAAGGDGDVNDVGQDQIQGNAGHDVIAGDNASITRTGVVGSPCDGWVCNTFKAGDVVNAVIRVVKIYDVAEHGETAPDTDSGGGDEISGNQGYDVVYAGAGADTVNGNENDDVIFGNAGNDIISGDAGQDDLIGGTGRIDSNSATSAVDGRLDGDDTIHGNDDYDAIAGDNARMVRTTDDTDGSDNTGPWVANTFNGAVARTIALLDVGDTGLTSPSLPGTGGNDLLFGDAADDTAYGQGGNDGISGGTGQDLLEGNENGSGNAQKPFPATDPNFAGDLIHGDDGADDIVGGTGWIWTIEAGVETPDNPVGQLKAGVDGRFDGGDWIAGDGEADSIAGDNAVVERALTAGGAWIQDDLRADTLDVIRRITRLLDVATATNAEPLMNLTSGNDTIAGNDGYDVAYAQGGDDTVNGNEGDDRLEGNAGDDTIDGDAGQDDIAGGSGRTRSNDPATAVDGRIDDSDGGTNDTIAGDLGEDTILGDNGTIDRPPFNASFAPTGLWVLDDLSADQQDVVRRISMELDVQTTASVLVANTSGNDTIDGNEAFDTAYGQGGDDTVHGNDGDDHLEGNAGDDTLWGDAGQDDLIGGTGRTKSNDPATAMNTRVDNADLDAVNDTINGGDGQGLVLDGDFDVILGDNGTVDRTLGAAPDADTLPSNGVWGQTSWNEPAIRRAIRLYDVSTFATPALPSTAGEDELHGEADDDVIFGQGANDTITGNGGSDYIEGNHANDLIHGNLGEDDIAGGGSAADGILDANRDGELNADRSGEDLRDGNDTITGDDGDAALGDGDVLAGDNARIYRPLDGAGNWKPDAGRGTTFRDVQLFDIQKVGGSGLTAAPAEVSGVDKIDANGGPDIAFGQGSGSSGSDADPFGTESGLGACQNMGANGPGSGPPFSPTGDDDNDDLPDLNDPQCRAADSPGDEILGQDGQDYLEGNQGSDQVVGGEAEDDITGGSSSNDGHIAAIRAKNERGGFAAGPPSDLLDGHDQLEGNGDDDTIAGDNAFIDRYLGGATGTWITISGPGRDADPPGSATTQHPEELAYGPYVGQTRRDVSMRTTPDPVNAFGDDFIRGGAENDDLYGQLGNDWIEGNEGEDAVVGDLGKIVDNLLAVADGPDAGTALDHPGDELADPPLDQFIRPNQPFLDDTINESGVLKREVELYSFNQVSVPLGAGHDVVLGGDGNDWIHTGSGEDLANGNNGDDRIYLGDSLAGAIVKLNPQKIAHDKVDAGWGGPGHDHIWGGYGADYLDVRPRTAATAPGIVPGDDPKTWSAIAGPLSTGLGDFQGFDTIYGGWDQDALQANEGGNGPVPGDRMLDWGGSYNIYYLCPATYGDWVTTRAIAPGLIAFLQSLSGGDGAKDATVSTSSGFRETAIVFSNEVKSNTNPVHPDTPGHFDTSCTNP